MGTPATPSSTKENAKISHFVQNFMCDLFMNTILMEVDEASQLKRDAV
jgi:hypothetical protein